jgi:glucose/arabinose dehydrogenase
MARKPISTIVLALASLMALPAVGQAADTGNTPPDVGRTNMLIGEDAFGGWQGNRPGVWRKIGAGDLPLPFATKSAGNAPGLVRRPADAVPQVPPGFKAELVVSGLSGPRTMVRAPNGDIFVADSAADRIVVLRMRDGQAKPTEQSVFASGLSQPYGIAFYPHTNPQWVYVGDEGSVVRFPYRPGDLKASGKAETVVRNLPTGGHGTRAIAFSPDDSTLYVAVGSASNIPEGGGLPPGGVQQWADSHPLGEMWGREEGRAAVLSFNPDGSHRQVFATGLRNCSGLTIQPGSGDPWCAVNERDGLGDNLPFDYATQVRAGNFYGWPWYYIGANPEPRAPLKGQRPDLATQVTLPDVLFQAHSAPLGIAFYDGSAFPADYRGDAFVTMHGSWNRASPTGYKVVRLKFDYTLPTGAYEDFVTGFATSAGKVWGRPTGVVVAHDGSLLVSEDGSGTIWRISYQKGS